MNRVIGSNLHGNKNELKLVEEINEKYFHQLNNNLKEFIKFIAKDNNIEISNNTLLNASYEPNTRLKQDLYIVINNQTFSVSLKMGSGNSVHQEKCEDFISYITNEFQASEEVCNDFRLFLWADGTFDGSGSLEKDKEGNIKCRFSAREFRERYPDKFNILQNFLNENKRKLIERFLFVGRHNSKVDYIYHGNILDGYWLSTEEIIEMNMENLKKDSLHVGKLSLQSWNISRKGTSEHKRGQLQIKYSQMKSDFFELMKKNATNVNTFLGNKEEFDISRRFNKNKNSPIWNELLSEIEDVNNVYMIKVSTKVLSHLSNKKVNPKADAYLVRSDFDQNYLLEKEYSLDESDLIDRDYEILNNTGVSVKIDGSTGYTIQKLTHDSFIKAFRDIIEEPEYLFLALLLYSNDREKYKNSEMMKMLIIEEDEVREYYIDQLGVNIDFDNVEDLSLIRLWAQKELKEAIQNNIEIYDSLFTGSTWFDEPYVAHFIYLNKEIHINGLTDFSITTGSGRSRGNYSIEIKPVHEKNSNDNSLDD